ncbi:glucosamine-6-phosphate deaminase NagB-II [Salinimonas lutimaris]|uniref:glucosamine-6-phosphate deaminase NagB-II n=1 Tax=Salinimonas lutimaris TaxID=914153 RepID=UPI0010C102C5|nr:SIS domain-containing protein [Salinimonas lutimaris]
MTSTHMAREAAHTPSAFRTQLADNTGIYQALARELALFQPQFVYMIGRGSSDHAGVFAKYLFETELGLPVAAAAPSVNSVFKKQLNLQKALVIVISQSGRSPDILAQAAMAKQAGALLVALVNDESSELQTIADFFVPLRAGSEIAVAATKSYLATLFALLGMVAAVTLDKSLMEAVRTLPEELDKVIALSPLLNADQLRPLSHCVVLGRAFGYAISREIALKLKEVCGIHAEAFSSAEFLHGPISLLNRPMTVFDVSINDATSGWHDQQICEVTRRGGSVISMLRPTAHPLISPLLIMQRFYLDLELAARQMQLDPDNPAGLKKVTETI